MMKTFFVLGLLLEHERQEIEATRLRYNKYWIPIHWVTGKIVKLQKEGKISSDIFASKVVDVRFSYGQTFSFIM